MKEIYIVILLTLSYCSVFLLTESLFRYGMSREISRKLAHILGAGVTMLLPVYGSLFLAAIFGAVFTLFILSARRYGFIRSIHEEPFAYGSVFFPVGLTLACYLFWDNPTALMIGIAVFGVADPVAALIGGSFGKKSYDISGLKTIEGSVAFFVASIVVMTVSMFVVHAQMRFIPVIVVSVCLAAVEGLLGKGKDNLILPSAAAFAVSIFL